MYIHGSKQYEYHVENYGHPSKVGYKDLVGEWKAEKSDPDCGLRVKMPSQPPSEHGITIRAMLA